MYSIYTVDTRTSDKQQYIIPLPWISSDFVLEDTPWPWESSRLQTCVLGLGLEGPDHGLDLKTLGLSSVSGLWIQALTTSLPWPTGFPGHNFVSMVLASRVQELVYSLEFWRWSKNFSFDNIIASVAFLIGTPWNVQGFIRVSPHKQFRNGFWLTVHTLYTIGYLLLFFILLY